MTRKIRINYANLLASMQPEDRATVLKCAGQLEEKLELSHRDSLELLAKLGASFVVTSNNHNHKEATDDKET
jgi:hypothetical protein